MKAFCDMFEIVARLGVLIDGENIFKGIKGEREECVACLDLGCVCLSVECMYIRGCVCVCECVNVLAGFGVWCLYTCVGGAMNTFKTLN